MTHYLFTADAIYPFLPAIIMFFITISFTALLFMPALRLTKGNRLFNFYWSGFWIYLGLIAAMSGATNVLKLAGYGNEQVSNAVLLGLSASFVFFVMFAWARLSSTVLIGGLKRIRSKVSVNSKH